MSSVQKETHDTGLTKKLDQYNHHIIAVIAQLCDDTLIPDSIAYKQHHNDIIEEKLQACFYMKKQLDIALLAQLKAQQEKEEFFKHEEQSHAQALKKILRANANEIENNQKALYLKEKAERNKLKHALEKLMAEIERKIQEIDRLISALKMRILQHQVTFLRKIHENIKDTLLNSFTSYGDKTEIIAAGYKFCLHTDNLISAVDAVIKEGYQKISQGNEAPHPLTVEKKIYQGVTNLLEEDVLAPAKAVRAAATEVTHQITQTVGAHIQQVFHTASAEAQTLNHLHLSKQQILLNRAEHLSEPQVNASPEDLAQSIEECTQITSRIMKLCNPVKENRKISSFDMLAKKLAAAKRQNAPAQNSEESTGEKLTT